MSRLPQGRRPEGAVMLHHDANRSANKALDLKRSHIAKNDKENNRATIQYIGERGLERR